MSKMRKALSWLLALVMVLSLVPMSAFAAVNDTEFHINGISQMKELVAEKTGIEVSRITIHSVEINGTRNGKPDTATGGTVDHGYLNQGDVGAPGTNGRLTGWENYWTVLNDASIIDAETVSSITVYAKYDTGPLGYGGTRIAPVSVYLNPEDVHINVEQLDGKLITEIGLEHATLTPQYTLTYDANGGTGSIEAKSYEAGTEATVLTVTEASKSISMNKAVLLGFSTEEEELITTKEDAGKVVFAGSTITMNAPVTLYAVWAQDENGNDVPDYDDETYTVTYSWTGAPEVDVYDADGEAVILKLPEDPNTYLENNTYSVDGTYSKDYTVYTHDQWGNVNGKYTFSGWTDLNNGTVGKANVTITGEWKNEAVAVDKHTVTYEWSGTVPEGVSLPADATVTNGAPYTAADGYNPIETDEGTWTFNGWTPASISAVTKDETITGSWTFTEKTPEPEDSVWNNVYNTIRIYMDEYTQADFDALEGSLSQQVRIYSDKYPEVDGYRLCGYMPIADYWYTSNVAVKVTAADIEKIALAKDNAIGSSGMIQIPIEGNEIYSVKVSEGTDGVGLLSYKYLKIEISKNPDAVTYSVTYDGNGATSGTVPVDARAYKLNDTVIVLGNTGDLEKDKAVFLGFSQTQTNLITTAEAQTAANIISEFSITGNTKLYAVWAQDENGNGQPDYTEPSAQQITEITVYIGENLKKENPNLALSWYCNNLHAEYGNGNDEYIFLDAMLFGGGFIYDITGTLHPIPDTLTTEIDTVDEARAFFKGFTFMHTMVPKASYDSSLISSVKVEGTTLTMILDKTPTTKEIGINYWDIENNTQAGEGKLTVDKDATYINTSALTDIPEGYELVSTGDLTIRDGWVYVEVKPVEISTTAIVNIRFMDGDEFVAGGDYSFTEGVTVTFGELTLPEGYELDTALNNAESGFVARDGAQIIVHVKKISTTAIVNIRYMDGDEFVAGGDYSFTEGVTVTFGELTLPEGYELDTALNNAESGFVARDGAQIIVHVKKITSTVIMNIRFVEESTGKFIAGGDYFLPEGVQNYNILLPYVPDGYQMCVSGDFMVTDGGKLNVPVEKISTTGIMNIRFVEESTGKFISGGDYILPLGVQNYNILNKYVPDGYQMCVAGDFMVTDGGKLDVPVKKTASDSKYIVRFYIANEEGGSYRVNGRYVKAVNLVAEYDEDLGTYVVQFPTLKVNKDYELTGWKVSGRYTAIWHEDSSEVRGVEGLVNANNYLTITPIFEYTGDDHPTVETRYTIEATAHKGGEISPDGIYKVYKYSDKTYTITADKGYKIYDVVVDGVSVGAVHTYTFERVTEDHTIEVYFAKLPTDPDDSGTSNWLETKDHVAYMTGYPDGTFGPNRNMTRAEVAQMFYALLLNKNVTTTVAFSDVSADAWYAKAVNTLASLGMVSGYPDGTFHPDAPITRAEFATIALAFAYEPLTASCNYNDVPTSAWFYTYVAQATTYGWIGGSNGYFRPNDNITRAEVSVIVNNMLGRAADEDYVDAHAGDLVTFPDVRSSFWGYYSIMETVNDHEYVKLNGLEDWK